MGGRNADGPKVENYSDPFDFRRNGFGLSRHPHVHREIDKLKTGCLMQPSIRIRLRLAILPVSILLLFACAKSQVKIYPDRPSPIEPSAKVSPAPPPARPSSTDSREEKPLPDSPQAKLLPESPRSKSPGKTYSEAVSEWKSDRDLVRWMEKEFSFDADRFKKFERTLPPPRTPDETFQLKSGIYIDAALFTKETLSRIDPSYKPKIGVLIIRPYGVNHYFCSFRKGEKLFIMDYGTPFKETTGIHGPYNSLGEIKKFYQKYLPITGHIETISYLP